MMEKGLQAFAVAAVMPSCWPVNEAFHTGCLVVEAEAAIRSLLTFLPGCPDQGSGLEGIRYRNFGISRVGLVVGVWQQLAYFFANRAFCSATIRWTPEGQLPCRP